MKRLLRIARTEVLEHRRQPAMLFILIANYVLWIGAFGVTFVILNTLGAEPGGLDEVHRVLAANGQLFGAFMKLATSTFISVLFTNLPLFVAIMAGSSVLHDRDAGTMPFLMLAPVTRPQLLLGKLLGVMALPVAFHFLFVGVSSVALGQLALLAPHAYKFGAASAWWLAFGLGAPASAAFVGALGTVISALSRDIRTSMQFTSFSIGLLSLVISGVLVGALPEGPLVQLAFAAACLVATALTLALGARLISRDVTA